MSWRALPDRCQQRNSGEDIAIHLTWRSLLLRGSRNGKPVGFQGKITVNEQVTIIKDRYILVTSSPSWLVMTIFKMLSGQDVSISSSPAGSLTKHLVKHYSQTLPPLVEENLLAGYVFFSRVRLGLLTGVTTLITIQDYLAIRNRNGPMHQENKTCR